MSNRLKEVTYLAKKQIKNKDVVLPNEYTKTFGSISKLLNIDIEDDNVVLKNIHHDFSHVDKIIDQTNSNLSLMQVSNKKAQKAIIDKDEKTLSEVSTELQKMQEQINFLQKELFSDSLTKVYNRKWFVDMYLSDDKFTQNGKLAFLDLNKFKIINDTYGHIVGDQVLKYLANFLKKELVYEGIDIVRYAGDEFMILFDENAVINLNIERVMEDLQEKLSQKILKSSKIEKLQFTFSYGLVDFDSGDDATKTLDVADSLMYENKQKFK